MKKNATSKITKMKAELLKNRFVSFLVFVFSMIIGGYVYDAIKIAEEDSMIKFVAYLVMLPILWLWYNRFTVYDE